MPRKLGWNVFAQINSDRGGAPSFPEDSLYIFGTPILLATFFDTYSGIVYRIPACVFFISLIFLFKEPVVGVRYREPLAPVAYQVILEPGIGQFREFESPRVYTRINSWGLFLMHKLTCGKRESAS